MQCPSQLNSELKNKDESRRVWVLRVPYKGEWRDEVRNGKVYLSEDLSSKRATLKALQWSLWASLGQFHSFQSVLEKSFPNQTMQNTLPPRNQCQDRSFVLGRGWGGFNAIIDDHSSLKENRNTITTVYKFYSSFHLQTLPPIVLSQSHPHDAKKNSC